jgi:phenylacetate-CoA ligase
MDIISILNLFPGNSAAKGLWVYTHVPQRVLDRMAASAFRSSIRYAAEHSPFYKRKFAERRIDARAIARPEDLGDFFTTAEDIRANVQEFVCARPDTAYETTGTTSKRTKRVYFSRSEIREAGWSGAVGLWGMGIRPEDRVASAFDYSFWVSGPVLQASCEVIGCFHVEAGRLHPAEFYDRLKDYGITVIVGDPSWIVRLAEIAKEKGPWPLKLLIAGGENLTEEARRFVEDVWKADFILSYGQTEAFGAIGIESRVKEGYYINEFHNAFEIINRDADGYGELVYTTLNRRVMPLIRYRSGDITRFITTPSKDGLPARRIEKLRGRINEWIPTAMGNIAPWMFEDLFGKIPGLSDDWQILISKEGTKDLVEFQVECLDGQDPVQLRDTVLSAFRSQWPEEARVVAMGLLRVDVKAHAKGTLRQGRKMQRLVDTRKF